MVSGSREECKFKAVAALEGTTIKSKVQCLCTGSCCTAFLLLKYHHYDDGIGILSLVLLFSPSDLN